MRNRMSNFTRGLGGTLPKALFCFFLCMALLGYGIAAGRFRLFPFNNVKSAYLTAATIYFEFGFEPPHYGEVSKVKLADLGKSRILSLAEQQPPENFLFTGGWNLFREYCPEYGCAAVVLARDGHLVHAYPLRPQEFAARTIAEFPHEAWHLRNVWQDNAKVFGIVKIGGGDLLVTFHERNDFPYGNGLARIDQNGHVRWYLNTYTHHWPAVSGDEILVTSSIIRNGKITFPLGKQLSYTIKCGGPYPEDVVQVLDMNGKMRDQISVLGALLASPYRAALYEDTKGIGAHPCDPLHLNSVAVVGDELSAALKGTSPDDILVSIRNISAFAIIGRKSHRMKYFFRGSFRFQHSVHPYEGSKVVMFDDLGQNNGSAPSRVLLYDVATYSEHVVFSKNQAPDHNMFSQYEGGISISPDRKRLLVFVSEAGEAYELSMPSGRIVSILHNLQDLHGVPAAGPAAKTFALTARTHGIYYDR